MLNRSREDFKRALTRADGWALRLTPYDYVVEYVEGRFNIADPSSRLYDGHDGAFNETAIPWEIAKLEANAVGFLTEEEIKKATVVDSTLTQVSLALETGIWPKHLRKFEVLADNLHTMDGLITKEGRVVIPEALRPKALEVAHDGHPMAGKLKTILRERVWWPGMTKDAEEWVKSCQTCATNGNPERTTPMQRIFAPKNIWETIAVDFNGPYSRFGGIYILVLVEYRSRYIIAHPVKLTSFEYTRSVLDDIFYREGFPKNIKTDNGPPFNGQEFSQYCADRGIKTVYSTPLFPQQNGLIERYMKLINKAMITAASNGTHYMDEHKAAVKAHNCAAHAVTKVAPEVLMNGRKIHRGLPLLMRGKVNVQDELIDQRDQEAKLEGKKREDTRRGAKECHVLPGHRVIVARHSRAKGDSRFDPKKFTVMEQSNGNLLLSDDDG
ncbi:uncharacterized protein K02A2.6-like [Topomyia yanbarensis]|uniref:uncharacterized protein K02A2.6-like n=1 Tax=Topomyia yanbarensis TaxID=2498891 RepID=UPI00273CE147|nr:uncharacterized protein K02A2.6-like [Topomyia yanbarensis]